jgi:DNA-binding response OmpR family regulator
MRVLVAEGERMLADTIAEGLRRRSMAVDVCYDGDAALSPKEFAVLEVLMRAEGAVVSAEELLEKAWDENADPFTNAVRVTLMTLRRELGDPPVIETIPGAGYRLGS